MALNRQKKTNQEVNLDQSFALNLKWWVTEIDYHTLERYIVKIFNKIDRWQYVIDKMKF